MAEAPGAILVAETQDAPFAFGAMPAISLYRSIWPHLLLGMRMRGGLLRDAARVDRRPMRPGDGDPRSDPATSPGYTGFGSLTIALRMRHESDRNHARHGDGFWLELAVGSATTDGNVRPTIEAGVGWGLPLGSINLGPMMRFVYVDGISHDAPTPSANLMLFGLEVSLFDDPTRHRRRLYQPVALRQLFADPADSDSDGIGNQVDDCHLLPEDRDGIADQDGCPEFDADSDRIADQADACPTMAEVHNGIADHDGCPDHELFILDQQRLILQECVLFDSERARVKREAREMLRVILEQWKNDPDWDKILVRGHADGRGSAEYNQRLSETRAMRVRKALIELGVPSEKIEAVGYGVRRPRDMGSSEQSHQLNRRVEFVFVKSKSTERPGL